MQQFWPGLDGAGTGSGTGEARAGDCKPLAPTTWSGVIGRGAGGAETSVCDVCVCVCVCVFVCVCVCVCGEHFVGRISAVGVVYASD